MSPKKIQNRRPRDQAKGDHRSNPRSILRHYKKTTLVNLIAQAKAPLEKALSTPQHEGYSHPLILFFSFTDGMDRATVVHFSGQNVDEIWKKLADWRRKLKQSIQVRWLRIDWVTHRRELPWADCLKEIQRVKRNYFRYGISLDTTFRHAFLEQELNANAMLYLGSKEPKAKLNPKNFRRYGANRFGTNFALPDDPLQTVALFTTEAILFQPDSPPETLHGYSGGEEGRNTGRRVVNQLTPPRVKSLIEQSSQYLADQVDDNGRFTYGIHPCFDREIKAYNTLRHASTTYSMLEAWELTRSMSLKAAIDRSIGYLTKELISKHTLPSGEAVAYLQDSNDEIKLGGNAVCLLALVKYTELTEDDQHLPLMEQIAAGIQQMQNGETGQLYHVLNAKTLKIKTKFRVIYYDGEAAFGLMRFYGLTRDQRWLDTVEKAFSYFIQQEHWRIHDHWLSYCVNELTLYRPEEKYYEFGIKNVAGHLDFVIGRITTYPTLLELMMAAHKMIARLRESGQHRHLLKQIDTNKFYRALETRAKYLLNGFFWPEFAIYFQNPQRILGSFFIRHHSFRVRIDDVEHYLSGYVAYLSHYLNTPDDSYHSLKNRSNISEPPSGSRSNSQASKTSSILHTTDFATVMWGGDVNLGRRQHYRAAKLGYENVLRVPEFKHADLSIVNLECVISTLGEQGIVKGEGGPYYYRARPEMLRILATTGIDAVAVANNHSGDYGPSALMQQAKILQEVGISSVGSGTCRAAAFNPVYFEVGGVTVALFAIDSTQHRFAAGKSTAGTAYLSLSKIEQWKGPISALFSQARKKADVVLVSIHWGRNHAPEPEESQTLAGHALIDAGADAILGSSAHRLQGIEVYRHKPIIHDAGDLLFDAKRKTEKDSGVFRLGIRRRGVCWVEFLPVGAGFGFSQRLRGKAAQEAISRYQKASEKLGTKLNSRGDSAILKLSDFPDSAWPRRSNRKPFYNLNALQQFQPDPDYGQVPAVPESARISPVALGKLTLLGVRITPDLITRRQILWTETWWTAPKPLHEDLRLTLRAIPQCSERIPVWGRGMDHDPCDWLQPTSRWQPGKIYRDFYGLRPPPFQRLANCSMFLHIGVLGGRHKSSVYVYPIPVRVAIPKLVKNVHQDKLVNARGLNQNYRTNFEDLNLTSVNGKAWTADDLAKVTRGTWLTAPPEGWFVRSVVNGKKHISARDKPVLFVAHTNRERAFHESMSEAYKGKGLGDRHIILPDIKDNIAGAIVGKPVYDMGSNFPLLYVEDPIKAIIELGIASRNRYKGPVIAITGTVGKSSTLNMIGSLFRPGKCLKTEGNYNSRVGAPVQLASLRPDHEAALVEVAQSALWMRHGPITRTIRPTISAITEIGLSQTTKRVKSTKDTAKWKSRIFDGLTKDGTAVFGEHLLHYDYILEQAKHHASRIITFGTSEYACIKIKDIAANKTHTTVTLCIAKQTFEIDLPFLNKGMVNNALTAVAVAYALNIDPKKAGDDLAASYVPNEGCAEEFTAIVNNTTIQVIDDSWNATVLSMLNAFDMLHARQALGNKIAVLGRIVHLGELAENLHTSLADPLIQTGVDLVLTHGEEMKYLRKALPERVLGPHFSNARELISELSERLDSGDIVLLKGSRRDSDFENISSFLKRNRIPGDY